MVDRSSYQEGIEREINSNVQTLNFILPISSLFCWKRWKYLRVSIKNFLRSPPEKFWVYASWSFTWKHFLSPLAFILYFFCRIFWNIFTCIYFIWSSSFSLPFSIFSLLWTFLPTRRKPLPFFHCSSFRSIFFGRKALYNALSFFLLNSSPFSSSNKEKIWRTVRKKCNIWGKWKKH